MQRLSKIPLFVILMGVVSLSMILPAIVGVQSGNFLSARAFFYSALILITLTVLMGITFRDFVPFNPGRMHLITLVGAYAALPVLFAFPVTQALPDTTFFNAYFEMVSAFTTTGASTFDPDRLDAPLKFWQAFVGWIGGLFVWITAAAIFAPLNLGGYEIGATSEPGQGAGRGNQTSGSQPETTKRLIRVAAELSPVYAGLTLVLWICLIIAGETPLVGLAYSMATLSTSGITLGHSDQALIGGFQVEILLVLFLLFAISRRSFSTENAMKTSARLWDDHEMRTGALIISLATAALFLRHFLGAVEVGAEAETARAAQSLWGTFFSVVSFLTTTGFVSTYWVEAQGWSGLSTPGFALLGLAMIGGGVATTAGGVKLLRIYALTLHGRRELARLIHPSVVDAGAHRGARVGQRGVYVAWLFFMLFALSLATVWTALAFSGIAFEDAMLLTVSALSTTGPLAPVVSEGAIAYGDLPTAAKAILMSAMVLGRLETLALIALLNTEFWRN